MKNSALAFAMIGSFLAVYMGLVIGIGKLLSPDEFSDCKGRVRVGFEGGISSAECEYFKPAVPTNIPKYDYIRHYQNLQLSCK